MKKRFVKAMSIITVSAMLLSAVSGIEVWKQGRGANAMNVVLKNPDVKQDNTGTMLSGQKVTWDCVYFGSYPQAEIVSSLTDPSASPSADPSASPSTDPSASPSADPSASPSSSSSAAPSASPSSSSSAAPSASPSTSPSAAPSPSSSEGAPASPGAITASERSTSVINSTTNSYALTNKVVDSALYNNLKNSNQWDANNEMFLNGVRYRRMRRNDATYKVINGAVDGYYQWEDDATYHYFRYEDIKWRVLSTDGKKALLLADIGLDNQYYDQSYKNVTWENCSVRSWLNGYAAAQNLAAKDYTNKGFINFAFNNDEAAAIMTTGLKNQQGKTTSDKVFLLSKSEISETAMAQAYGFLKSESYDEGRLSYCSAYAKAMGVPFVTLPVGKGERLDGCGQLLRNDGEASDYTNCTLPNGQFRTEANYYDSTSNLYQCYAIRPALYLDLSKTAQYNFAGTVCSDDTEKNAQQAATGRVTLPPASTSPSVVPSASVRPSTSASPSAVPSASVSPSIAPSASADPSAIPSASVSPSAIPTQQPSASEYPQVLQTPTPGETIVIENTKYIKKRFKDEDTMGVYQITKTGDNGTVIYVRPLDKTQSSVIIPDEVEYKDNTYRVVSVGEHAFYKNKNLRQITLGNNITKISNRAFYKCTNLQKINFNDKLKRIGTKAFFRCNSLKKIVLPSKVEHIGVRAFYKCKNLQKAVLSRNMLELGTKSFYKCKKLSLDMRKVKKRHIAMGRKPFTGVKQVRYGRVQTRP